MTGSGLDAGDEVAEVTSLRVGGGLLGQEGRGGLRGSEPRPARVDSNPPSPLQERLILGWSGLEGCPGEVTTVPSKRAGVDTSLVQCVLTLLLWGSIHGPQCLALPSWETSTQILEPLFPGPDPHCHVVRFAGR